MFKVQRLTALAGILVLLLAACGPAATPTPTAAPQPTPTKAAATATPVGPAPTATKPAPTSTPAPSPTPAFRIGGKLRVQTGEPYSMDPHAIGTGGAEVFHIHDPLLRLNRQLRLDPALAESWEIPDPTTLVFKLRKGVKFHDGSPFNAQVAKWNFERILDPNTVSPVSRPALAPLDRVEVVDDYTLRLRLKRPASDLLYYQGVLQFSMMTPTAVAKWGQDVGAHPVGTGPYIFQDWVPARSTRMTRNPDYWDSPKPYIQDIEWVITQDDTVILASLLTGALDLARVTLPAHQEKLEKTPGMTLYPTIGGTTTGLFINHLKPPMNNLDFRQALNLALNREGMIESLLHGRGGPVSSLFHPSFPEYNNALPVVKRDVAKARELVAKSGYKGQTLDFLCYPFGITGTYCEMVQAQLKDAGVNTQINMAPSSAAIAKAMGQVLYDIAWLGSNHMPLELRATIYLYSTGRLNSGRFGNTPEARKLDQLIEQIGSTYDWDTRIRLFRELQEVVYNNVMDIYSFYQQGYYVARERVRNFEDYPGVPWLAKVWVKD